MSLAVSFVLTNSEAETTARCEEPSSNSSCHRLWTGSRGGVCVSKAPNSPKSNRHGRPYFSFPTQVASPASATTLGRQTHAPVDLGDDAHEPQHDGALVVQVGLDGLQLAVVQDRIEDGHRLAPSGARVPTQAGCAICLLRKRRHPGFRRQGARVQA